MGVRGVRLEYYQHALAELKQREGESFHDWMVRVNERAMELQAKDEAARLPYKERDE